MDQEFFEQFTRLRKLVNSGIEHYLKEDCGHKSYEGAWDITFGYPNYFEDDTGEAPPCYCKIELHCYVIGPSRHYEWTGKTSIEALRKAQADVRKWVHEEMAS